MDNDHASNSGLAPLVAIAGPTGSGKSEAALRLASEFPAEIVNCDSVQVYRYFDIGTAKLSAAERGGVPHHLLDDLDPEETFTAGDFIRTARPILHDVARRKRLPLVVGGSGFYLRALFEGLFEGPERDPSLRTKLAERERRRPGCLHRILRRLDWAAAEAIHRNDTNKLIRALEVCILTRRPLSELYMAGRNRLSGFRPLKLALDPPREQLYRKLDQRTRTMFEQGLVEEVERILAMGFSARSKPFESLGYRQAMQVVSGKMTLAEAVESTQRETRRYAKRQWTWFRREPGLEWVSGFGTDRETQRELIRLVESYLNGFPGFF